MTPNQEAALIELVTELAHDYLDEKLMEQLADMMPGPRQTDAIRKIKRLNAFIDELTGDRLRC